MDKSKKIIKIVSVGLVVVCVFFASDILAQCPMCRSAAESNLKAGGGNGRGLNAGILYMLAMPYILVSTIGFLWWRKRRKKSILPSQMT